MATTLRDVARQYERESMRGLPNRARRERLTREAALLNRIAANREAADPTRLNIGRTGILDVIDRWCRQHDYRCTAGINGVTVQRGTEPAIVAGTFDTLVWDGDRISIEEPEGH